jgi:hypothetical protein
MEGDSLWRRWKPKENKSKKRREKKKMFGNSIRSDPSKKDYTLSISEKEIENELSLIFDPQICAECRHDHSFKNSFQDAETSIDDFPSYLRNRISMVVSATGGIGI